MRLFYLEPKSPKTRGMDRGILPELELTVRSLDYESDNPSVAELEARHGKRVWFFPPELVFEHNLKHDPDTPIGDCGRCQERIGEVDVHRVRMRQRMHEAVEGII